MSTLVSESPASLDDLVADSNFEEVWVNGPNQVFVAETVDSQELTMVALESAHTPDRWHAEVGLSSLWSPPVVSHFLPAALRIRVEVRAQTFLR